MSRPTNGATRPNKCAAMAALVGPGIEAICDKSQKT